MRVCSICKKEKEDYEFPQRKIFSKKKQEYKISRQSYCNECRKIYIKKWKERKHERM